MSRPWTAARIEERISAHERNVTSFDPRNEALMVIRMTHADQMRARLVFEHDLHECPSSTARHVCRICSNNLAFCLVCRCADATLLHDCPGHPVSLEAQGEWNVVSITDHGLIMLDGILRRL